MDRFDGEIIGWFLLLVVVIVVAGAVASSNGYEFRGMDVNGNMVWEQAEK